MNRLFFFLLITLILLAIDMYVWQALRFVIRGTSESTQRWVQVAYWGFTLLSLGLFWAMQLVPPDSLGRTTRTFLMSAIGLPYMAKLLAVVILLIDDLRRSGQWLLSKAVPELAPAPATPDAPRIPRSEFMAKTALIAGGGLLGTFAFGILSGAHDYRIRRVRIALKNLPKEFEGIRLAQLSDIHSGSFFNRTAVKGGVEMLMAEKPDLLFFTGDLVNDRAEEVKDYFDIFSKLSAPLGVYTTLGNHDYGDYYAWPSAEAKRRNLADLITTHKNLGWQLLLDEHRPIQVDGAQIGLLGIQNWGAGGFAKYGNLAKAHQGTDEYPVKILLSHDPSHWDAQVVGNYPDIDLALAGHTHGMQFGIEIPGFKWSPVQYRYARWGGLYEEADQYLYVNRGFGYIGYPGRVGILPEITLIELVRAV